MKVLLCEDVENLGWYGDVVEVKEGYARNYLLPQRIAVAPSKKKMEDMAAEKAKRAEIRTIALENMKKVAAKVEGAEVVIAAKVNEQGNLFGSISEHQIADNLRQQGFEVADKCVRLDHHLKEAGQFDIRIKFAADVTATIKLTIVPEGQVAQETADDSAGQTNAE
jgi:large subunit ribosomal protein L9